MRGRTAAAAFLALALVGCGAPGAREPAEQGSEPGAGAPGATAGDASVWSVDLIRTAPGRQDEFLASIEANWGSARALAVGRGAVRRYRALAASPDSLRGWDVLLMTEYADSAAYADREAIFQDIFASPDYSFTPMSAPADEIRSFVSPDTSLRTVVEGGAP